MDEIQSRFEWLVNEIVEIGWDVDATESVYILGEIAARNGLPAPDYKDIKGA